MQVFRLVRGGYVDRMIAFDSLPESMVKDIPMRTVKGLPRHWHKWLADSGCFLYKREIGGKRTRTQEPGFFMLDYKYVNAEKQKWEEITNYVRRTSDPNFRLMDKIEDMAVPMAPDCKSAVSLEPEDIPVIPLPKKDVEEPIQEAAPVQKRRGRPPKVREEVSP